MEFLIRGIEDTNVKAYYDFMVDAAVIFGANKSQAELELLDSLKFEIELAKVQNDKCTKKPEMDVCAYPLFALPLFITVQLLIFRLLCPKANVEICRHCTIHFPFVNFRPPIHI